MKAETKLRVAACAAGFALPRYNDLPSVGLYLDQTVQFVNGYFRSFCGVELTLSLIHISEPTRPEPISYAVFCLKKKT